MIKLVSDTIDKNDINALIEWLGTDEIPRLTKGSLTVELEKKWAKKIGTKYSVFVNSGSSAILLTLAALKYTDKLKNNKIVVPAVSWATDVSSPMLLGYETTLCDCNMEDLSVDISQLETIFIQEKPSVFILVTVLGLVPDMAQIVELCNEHDVILIMDNCESMGSKYNGIDLGRFGFASLFSTYFGHHISTIEGGFINTNDENFNDALLMMRSHGWIRDLSVEKQKKINERNEFDSLYTFYLPGLNVRSTDLQAFIGLRAIDKLDSYAERRYKNFVRYKKLVKYNELKLRMREEDFISNFAYPVVNKNKNKIVKELQQNDIEVRPLIAGNMATQPFWVENGFSNYLTRNACRIDNNGFYVPNHHNMSYAEVLKIATIINKHG